MASRTLREESKRIPMQSLLDKRPAPRQRTQEAPTATRFVASTPEIDESIHIDTEDEPSSQSVVLSKLQFSPLKKGLKKPKRPEVANDPATVREQSHIDEDPSEIEEKIESEPLYRRIRREESTANHENPSHTDVRPGEFVSIDLFEGIVDIGQSYKMDKWVLHNFQDLEERLFSSLSPSVEVMGVCGAPLACRGVMAQFLEVDDIPVDEDKKNSCITAFFVTRTSRLCLYFWSKNKTIFTLKPYRGNSKENIYFQLLLDLCATVVVCPSEGVQNLWYTPRSGEPAHPFEAQSFDPEAINFQSKTFSESEIKEMGESRREQRAVSETEALRTKTVMQLSPLSDALSQPGAELILSSDCFPCVFIKTSEKFNPVAATAEAKEMLGYLYRDFRYFIMKNGEIRDSDFMQFSGLDTFAKIIKSKFTDGASIIEDLKDRLKKASNDLMTEVIAENVSILALRLSKVLSVAQGALDIACDQVKYEVASPSGFVQCCMKHFRAEAVLGIAGHAGAIAQSREKTMKALEVEIRTIGERLRVHSLRWLDTRFQVINVQIQHALQVKDDLLNSYNVKLARYSLELLSTSVFCSEESDTNEFRLPDDPETSDVYIFDQAIAFGLFKRRGFFRAEKFNPDPSSRKETAVDEEAKAELRIVSGSISQCFVALQGMRAYYSQISQGRFISSGNNLEIYKGEVRQVKEACFLPERRLLYLINQEGKLFVMDLKQPEQGVKRVMKTEEGKESAFGPKNGTEILMVRSSSDESFLVLVTDKTLEVFNTDLQPLAQKRLLKTKIINLKVHSKEYNHYFIATTNDQPLLKVYHFVAKGQYSIRSGSDAHIEEIGFNPIVDCFVYALKTFGYYVPLTDEPRPAGNQKNFLIYVMNGDKPEIAQYPASIPHLRGFFGKIALVQKGQIAAIQSERVELEEFKWRVGSRQPIHVCSIQDEKLIPLRNGKIDISEYNQKVVRHKNYIQAFADYCKMGYLETLLEKEPSPLVVSVIGKQSSGKSYLLNRLFDTRFDVSSNRCTDGVWMSVAKVDSRTVVVLDCEGLFSMERSEQEEIKLCLFVAAMSDVTILNQDLAMGKHLAALLEKFEKGTDRLKGEKLFKGILNIIMRDVSEPDGAHEDLFKVIKKLSSQRRAQFIEKMFQRTIRAIPMHYYEAPEFHDEVIQLRKNYLGITPHWANGKELLDSMKVVLAQINSDDMLSLDQRVVDSRVGEIVKKYTRDVQDRQKVMSNLQLEDGTVTVPVSVGGESKIVTFKMQEVKIDREGTFHCFQSLFGKYFGGNYQRHHKDYYSALSQVAVSFHLAITAQIREKFLTEFQADMKETAAEKFSTEIRQELDKFLPSYQICLRQCRQCRLECVQPQHEKGDCDCSTDHKCAGTCELCGSKCRGRAAHEEKHDCGQNHGCEETCYLCAANCTREHSHDGEHRCGNARHPCDVQCEAFEFCGKDCCGTKEVDHQRHQCGAEVCGAQCSAENCSGRCANPNHLHAVRSQLGHACQKHLAVAGKR